MKYKSPNLIRSTMSDKSVHFGSISIPLARKLHKQRKYSLEMILLYIDSRKKKALNDEYYYTFEYNAPDIHYNTGIRSDVINRQLWILKEEGILECLPDRTSKGARKYKVVKAVYEEKCGPAASDLSWLSHNQASSHGALVLSESTPDTLSGSAKTPVRDTPESTPPGSTNDNEHMQDKEPNKITPASTSADATVSSGKEEDQNNENDDCAVIPALSHSADYDYEEDTKYHMTGRYVKAYLSQREIVDAFIKSNPALTSELDKRGFGTASWGSLMESTIHGLYNEKKLTVGGN